METDISVRLRNYTLNNTVPRAVAKLSTRVAIKKVYPTIDKRKYVNEVNVFMMCSTDNLTGRSADAHYLTPPLSDLFTKA